MASTDPLAGLYQQFDPGRPLEAEEEDLYVNWQQELGYDDVKMLLANSISRTSTATCRLFTGHRGVGKTTELKRIAKRLSEGHRGRKLFVCFLEAEGWLDLNNPEPTDLVYSIVRKIVTDLKNAGVSLAWEKFSAFIGEFREIVNQDVELKAINFKLPLGAEADVEVTDALRQGAPKVRAGLRKLLEGQQLRLFDLANEVIGGAREKLREGQGYDDIVVIVDGLEKIPRKMLHENDRVTNHESIFVDNAPILKFLDCSVLYTIPVELAYSHCRNRLQADYSEVFFLPVIPVELRSGKSNPPAATALREIVEKRMHKAGADPAAVFEDPADLERLIRLSGGHVRNLFISLRAVCDRSDDLPIRRGAVKSAVSRLANDNAFGLAPAQWEVLLDVHEAKAEPSPERCEAYKKDPEVWYHLLRDLFAFAYEEDGRRWYDWNPLLGEIER